MAQVVVALLLLLAAGGAIGVNDLCPQHCQECTEKKPIECPDNRGLIPRPDCASCCVVCAKKIGESCDDKQNPCAYDLQCTNGKCEDLPVALRPSDPPIVLVSAMALNSSTVQLVVRLPGSPVSAMEVAVTMSRQAAGPWSRVEHMITRTRPNGALELTVTELEGTVHLLRVEHDKLRSRAVRVELPSPEITTGVTTCGYQGREFTVGEGYLSSNCLERCECTSSGNFSCSTTTAEAAEACRGAARKLELLEVMDSTEDSVSLSWRGPAGLVLQSRAVGTAGPWQRAERLTPDGSASPANITLMALQPLTSYEVRAVLPGAEEARSARGEDTNPMAMATTRPAPGQSDAGFCVVLGRKIATGEEIPTPNGGCSEQKCTCLPGKPSVCHPRCTMPFFKRGAFSDDPLCQERPSPEDSCCVLLTCSDNSLVTEEVSRDPCDQCAEHAECHKSVVASMADEALCMCKDGYVGDPYDKKTGCKLAVEGKEATDKMDRCVFKNVTYSPGERFTDGCEHLCTCTDEAEIMCQSRCPPLPEKTPAGCKLVTDSKDECCRILKCDTKDVDNKSMAATTLASNTELFDGCNYKNKTYQKGEKFEDGCEKQCECSGFGDVFCKPRCAPPAPLTSDKCVTLRDPHDSCCTVVLCDVTLEDQEVMKVNAANLESENNTNVRPEAAMVSSSLRITVEMVEAVNASAVQLIARLPSGAAWQEGAPEVAVFVSKTKDGPWTKAPGLAVSNPSKGALQLTVAGLEPGTARFRVQHADMRSDEVEIILPAPAAGTTCEYKGKMYTRDEEFHDGCDMYCACTKTGIQCATIECPTDFGLDVLDPHCLDWEAEPGFVATPPRCCPDMQCRDNGSCQYRGSRFDNFAEIPTKLSGCEQRCYCEFGNVSCNPACPPVPAAPPSNLQCSSNEARLAHLPGEECCLYWLCPQTQTSLPPSMTGDSSNVSTPSTAHSSIGANMTSLLDHDITTPPSSPTPDMTPSGSSVTSLSPDTTNQSTEKSLPGIFAPTPVPEETEKSVSTTENVTKDISKNTEILSDKIKNSRVENEMKEFKGPFVLMPEMDSKNKSENFGLKELDSNEGPIKIRLGGNNTKESPSKTVPIVPGDIPGPFVLDRPTQEDNHQHLGPFTIPGRTQQQVPPGPFLFHGEPLPGPISENGPPPHIIGHTPDGHIIVPHDHRDPNLVPIRGSQHPSDRNPPHGHQQQPQFPYHQGQIPPFLQQRPPGNHPSKSNRPQPPFGLSPIAAQIEQHLQSHPGAGAPNRYHPEEEEVYHVRPHQGRPPPDAEIYHLPPDGEHFVLQDGSVVRIAPPPQQQRPNRPSNAVVPLRGSPHLENTQRRPQFEDHPLEHPQRPPIGVRLDHPDRPRPPHHVLHDELHPGHAQPPPTRPFLPPHLADLTPEQLLGFVRPEHGNQGNNTTQPQDPNAVSSSHSLDHAASAGQGFPSRPGMPPPFPPHQGGGGGGNELQLQSPQPINSRELRLIFSVPPIFVGLHGRVEVRYTDDPRKDDPSTWQRAASAADEIIESPQLVHEVAGLKPNTEYRIQVAVRLRDLDNALSSHIVTVRTPPDESTVSSTTLPPEIPIDAGLAVAEVNSTWMRVTWRKFSEYELQFIDGVQIRYKELDGKVYAATPLLHRLVDSYMLEELRPGTEYEVAIFFIPFPGQNTELQAERSVQATTAPLQADPYGFELALTVAMVKANSVELSWTGVPYPEDKYVNIYRAIYQSDAEAGKQELSSTFKLAKRDAPARTVVTELKPTTRYRIWLEAYLTNGKIKKSDVRTFTTKPGALPSAGASEQVSDETPRADYYGALVGVAIVAALAVVGLAILLMVLVKRQSAASAAITPRPAKAEAAYDNPSYKTCDDPVPATNGSSKHHSSAPEEA